MSKLLKTIQITKPDFDASAEGFFFHHSYLGFFTAFIGIPIFILGALTISTTIIMLPLSFLLGWL